MKDFYLVKRSIWSDPLFDNEPFTEREAWHWLISEASHRDHKVRYRHQMISILRGQVPTSYRKLMEKWQWSDRRIKRYLSLLSDDGKITVSDDAGFTLITLCNYSKFQCRKIHDADALDDADNDAGADALDDADDDKQKEGKRREKNNSALPSATVISFQPPLDEEAWGWVGNNFRITQKHYQQWEKEFLGNTLAGMKPLSDFLTEIDQYYDQHPIKDPSKAWFIFKQQVAKQALSYGKHAGVFG